MKIANIFTAEDLNFILKLAILELSPEGSV
jgi:hypothetical protein